MSDRAPRPKYEELADKLRAQIEQGEYALDAPLPSFEELKRREGVSGTVVRDALKILKSDGLVQGRQGLGTFVIARPRTPVATLPSLEDLGDQVRDLAADVAELRGLVEQLYDRLGHPLPNRSNEHQESAQRKTGTTTL